MSGCVAWSSISAAMGRECDSVNKGCMCTEESSWPVLPTQAVFLGTPTYSHLVFAARIQRNAYSDEQFIRWLRRRGPTGGQGRGGGGGGGVMWPCRDWTWQPGLKSYLRIEHFWHATRTSLASPPSRDALMPFSSELVFPEVTEDFNRSISRPSRTLWCDA